MSLKILALDTSTAACSVALFCDGQYYECYQVAPRQHNELILKMLEQALAEAGITAAQLDAISFGCGPGSFTGLRISASIVQSIAFAFDLPVVPVSTLQALAQGAYREFACEKVVATLNACINEVYYGCYKVWDNSMVLQGTEIVCQPADIQLPEESGWVGAGDGWDAYHMTLQSHAADKLQKWLPDCFPHARDIAELALLDYRRNKFVQAEQALPVYLRNNIVKKGIPHG